MMRLKNLLLEAEYTHVGYGKYKEKGKEKDPSAQTFKKDDQGKFIPIKSDEPTGGKDVKKDTPKVNIFDKPAKEKPQSKLSPKKVKDDLEDLKGTKSEKLMNSLLKGDSDPQTSLGLGDQQYDSLLKKLARIGGDSGHEEKFRTNNYSTAQLEKWAKERVELVSNKEKAKKSDTPKVSPTKLTQLMPKADKDTFSGNSDINKIPDAQKKEISMRIDKLAELTKQAKEKGEAAPNFNLCKVTVPGTNLYCSGNAGIPREEMPQFKGKPTPGSPASKMGVDASGEVDTEPVFKKMLKEKGIKTAETEIPSDALKATQSELVGSKVAGMAKALEKDPNHPAITAPIYVSRDGFVIDGHHRWAAVTSAAIAVGRPANMKVIVIDMDIKDAIPLANSFAEEIGVAAKKADANKETPSKEEPAKQEPSKPDRFGDKFELGTPAVYTDNGQEYRGEVVMNPSNQRVQIGGQWTTIGKGTTKGIQVYGSDTFIVPDDWNDAKSFDDAMEKPAQPKQQRKGNPAVNKEVKGLAEKEGFTPSQLGNQEYKTKMLQAAVSALSDANFHDEARELVAKLEGKPEWAKKPEYPSMDDPNFDEKMAAIRTNSSEASKFMQPDGKTWSFGRQIARTAGYDGVDAVDGLAFTLRMNGFHKEADAIQSVVQESYKGNISLTRLVEAKKYDIGSGYMGDGLTIWNRAVEKRGEYEIIAHISKQGDLKIYDKQLPNDIKKMFQIWADSMKKGNVGPKY